MKRTAIILLLINGLTVGFLIFSAKTEFLDWRESLILAKESLANVNPNSATDELYISSAQGEIKRSQTIIDATVEEYRRETRALWFLSLLNVVGFLWIAVIQKEPKNLTIEAEKQQDASK